MLPSDFPPWSTVYYISEGSVRAGCGTAYLWSSVRLRGRGWQGTRRLGGHYGFPKREDHRGRRRSNGYDAHKKVKGRKRHLLVDTLSLPFSVYVTPADIQDRARARLSLAERKLLVPRLKKI
jgi:putative transposase